MHYPLPKEEDITSIRDQLYTEEYEQEKKYWNSYSNKVLARKLSNADNERNASNYLVCKWRNCPDLDIDCILCRFKKEEMVEARVKKYIESQCVSKAEKIAHRGTRENWSKIRSFVYQRDNGICHVCGQPARGVYECGHIIDRCMGGCDRPSNLVVMCVLCNRMKPLHSSRQEYINWLADGDWRKAFERR